MAAVWAATGVVLLAALGAARGRREGAARPGPRDRGMADKRQAKAAARVPLRLRPRLAGGLRERPP